MHADLGPRRLPLVSRSLHIPTQSARQAVMNAVPCLLTRAQCTRSSLDLRVLISKRTISYSSIKPKLLLPRHKFAAAPRPFRTGVQGRVAGNPLPTLAATGRALIWSLGSVAPVDVLGCLGVKTRAVVPWRGSPRGTESYPLSGPGHLPRGPAQMPTCLDGTRAATPWRGSKRGRVSYSLSGPGRLPRGPPRSAQDRSHTARQWTSRTPTTCAAAPRRGARGQP